MASYQTQYGNYVKFLRGTPTTWAKIPESEKNSDTLYFISDTGTAFGQLYLGQKLIANGGLSSATSIKDLNDVLIGEGVTDNSLLVYDADTDKWEPKSLVEIFGEIIETFKGATAEANGTSGLVPMPQAGEQDLFLRADATWANPIVGMETTVGDLQSKLETLIGDDEGKSARDIADEVFEEQVGLDTGTFDSLKDLADWFKDNPEIQDLSELLAQINQLDETVNGTGDPKNGGLVQVTNTLQVSVTSIEGDVKEIKEALKWQDITEI